MLDCKAIYKMAHEAGMKAGIGAQVVPMGVVQHANPLDDNSPIVQGWIVEGGVCGFAWINISCGGKGIARSNSLEFCRWLKENDLARKSDYEGGYIIWVSEFGQSMTRKEAYARAFAEVLGRMSIQASCRSRMD